MRPHCLATFTDPRFTKIFFSNNPRLEYVREKVVDWVKDEMVLMEPATTQSSTDTPQNKSTDEDPFWGSFDNENPTSQDNQVPSIDSEINMWSGLSCVSRQSNPIHAMVAHGKDCPRVYKLFRKYSVFPATQNCDERLFSMVNRNTGALSRNIKVETIERKVVVGSAIQRHGFIFHYKNGNISSSDDEE